jgi:hypothetical protein
LICVHEFSIGVLVSAPRALDELRFGLWSAHHCPFYTCGLLRVPDGAAR